MKKVDKIQELIARSLVSDDRTEKEEIRKRVLKIYNTLSPGEKKKIVQIIIDAIEELENV